MNLQWKRAAYTLLLFGMLLLFLVVDLIVIGIDNYLNRGHFLLVAAMILVTMIVYYFMLYQTKNSGHLIDERDNVIQQKATSVALIITVMFVFLVSIGLFLAYENEGSLPVAWLWILAYLTYAMAYASSSFITVILYRSDNAN